MDHPYQDRDQCFNVVNTFLGGVYKNWKTSEQKYIISLIFYEWLLNLYSCINSEYASMMFQRQVSGNADLISVRDIKLRVISREMSLHRLALFVPNLRELNLEGSFLGSLRYRKYYTQPALIILYVEETRWNSTWNEIFHILISSPQ